MRARLAALCALAMTFIATHAHAQDASVPDAGATQWQQAQEQDEDLPEAARPRITMDVQPSTPVHMGDAVTVTFRVEANDGDDVNIVSQSYAPFEIRKRNVRIEPTQQGKRTYVFTVELLPFAIGELDVGPIRLRVLTAAGQIGGVNTPSRKVRVLSRLGNVPDAQPKPATSPVVVMEDDYTLAYAGAAILFVIFVALITLLVSRWWRKRKAQRTPPPPPRPAWEIALEALALLRRNAKSYIEDGRTIELVDGVSDALRVYLGARYGFDGLESTTDEVLVRMKRVEHLRVPLPEIATLLRDCDLVKFAKMIPEEAQCVAFFDAAEHIVRATTPVMSAAPTENGGRT